MGRKKRSNDYRALMIMGLLFITMAFAIVYKDRIRDFFSPVETGEEGIPIYIKIFAEDMLSGTKITSANIYVYDAQLNFVEKITTDTDGVGQSVSEYTTGSIIYVQAKKSGYYTTPLQQFKVPTNVPAEHTVASVGKVSMLKITTSVTLSATNDTGYSLTNNAQINSTDDTITLNILISGLDSDSGYGAPSDYVDQESGKEYKGGVILVVKLSNTLVTPTTDWDVGGTVGTDRYFIFYLDNVVDDSDIADDGTLSTSIRLQFASTGTSTLNVYIYDNLKISVIESLSFGSADASITSVTLRYS